MNKRTHINILATLFLQFVTLISGFIIPRLTLVNFGSDVNGLISSLTQFLNYISLIEGGISSVIMASLYTPLFEKNQKKISSIISASNKFFKKIACILVFYMIFLAIFYPFFINTNFNWNFIFSLTLILGVSLFIQYYFSLTWKLLLQADQKVYISSLIQSVVIIINTVLTIIAMGIFKNIHIIKLIASFSFVIQPILFNLYIKNKYNIDLSAEPDQGALSQRWDGFGINIAAFLHGNTDVVVLTVFSTLKNVSIYSVYNLVAMGIRTLITSISAGLVPTLGNNYAEKDQWKLNKTFNYYETIIFFVTYTIYTCAVLLIVPFVEIYTSGINDANYNQPIFSLLLILSMGIFCLREPYVNMAYTAGRFKDASKYAYGEAVINIIMSVSFVYFYGLNGVALGTFFSMLYRTICQVFYLKKHILKRKVSIFLKKILIFTLSSLMGYILCRNIFIYNNVVTWYQWIVYAFKTTGIVLIVNSITLYVFYKNDIREGS